ncbi:MAG TPA: helix-turn-helix domain-containing protein [Myxococcota bacterium]|nr:helix-turn-helix domain-containing protein [Myxococcota bacterium]
MVIAPSRWEGEAIRVTATSSRRAKAPAAAPPARRAEILAAAQRCFWKSGIRRSSIEDVANEAGLAKGTIYLYFRSKEELFAALAAELCAESLAGVERALAAPGSLAERLAAALDAKIGHFHRLLADSPHAPELLDSSAKIAAGSLAALDRSLQRALDGALREAGLGLGAIARAELVELILAAGYGTARRGELAGKLSSASQRAKLERHVELLLRSARASPSARSR